MSNQNGQLVLQTLQFLQQPSTITTICKEIANIVGADLSDVKRSVQTTLDAGVRHGYVQRLNQKYFSTPVDIPEMFIDMEEQDQIDEMKLSKQMQDRASKRRRTLRTHRRRPTRRISRHRRGRS